jgi:hypothetical protein
MTVRRSRGVGKGLGGNREVPPYVLRGRRGDLSGAQAEANDTPGAPTSEIVDFLKGKVPV